MSTTRTRTSSHWGSYWITAGAGKVIGVAPVSEDPAPSRLGRNFLGTLDGRTRIRRPAVRRGWLEDGPGRTDRRGADSFVEVDWDHAVELAAGELDRVRTSHGNEAIFGGSYGWGSAGRFHHAQSQVHRFLNSIGGYTRSVNTYSHAADEVILPHLIGNREWFLNGIPSWQNIAQNTEYVLAFGGLPRRSVQINPGGVGAHVNALWQDTAARRGVRFDLVTPAYADTGGELDAGWVPIRPNTDVALMLALSQAIIEEGLHDQDFLDRCCIGFDKVRAYLAGDADGIAKDPEWAEEITAVPAARIRHMARRLARERSMVTVTWSLQRQHHGEMAYWAGLTLAAIAGHMGKPGGGFGTGYSSMHNAHVHERVSPAAALPQGKNPVSAFIPVARISDMLLNPGGTFRYNGGTHTYPDIKLLYWIGGNPFHHHQDLNRMLLAFRKPETIIVHEPFWNPTAKHADIVFPVATSLEREDLSIGMADNWLSYMQQAVAAPPGIKTDYEVFAAIAGHLGAGEAFTEGRSVGEWVRELYRRSMEKSRALGLELPEFDDFVAAGAIELPTARPTELAFELLRKDPEAHPLETPSGRIELYSSTIAGFGEPDCPGQAVWLEPAEWLGSTRARRHPFHLVSPQPDGKLHSQFDHGPESRRFKERGRAVLKMNPGDMTSLGLHDGQPVRVFNDRGACLAVARGIEGLMPSVVQLPTGSWYDPLEPGTPGSLCKHGNPNVLTPDIGTSGLAQGPSAHTCLVGIEPFHDPLPELTAHEPPHLTQKEHINEH